VARSLLTEKLNLDEIIHLGRSSPLAVATAELVSSTASEPETPTSLSEPTEEMPILSLRRIAPPGFLTQSFAVDESGCTS